MGLTQSNHISYNTISSVGKEFEQKPCQRKVFGIGSWKSRRIEKYITK